MRGCRAWVFVLAAGVSAGCHKVPAEIVIDQAPAEQRLAEQPPPAVARPEVESVASSDRAPSAVAVEPWLGTWADPDTVDYTQMVVELVGGVPTVVRVGPSSAPESYGLEEARWTGTELIYRYYVPSTDVSVTISCHTATPDELLCNWSNTLDADGTVVLERVDEPGW